MKNKYDNLVEEINKKEEIDEQKDNLAEQLSLVTKKVNDVEEIVGKLFTAVADLKEVTSAVTAAGKSTDNCVNAITNAILESRKVVVTNKLDYDSIRQLKIAYDEHRKEEEKLLQKYKGEISNMHEVNIDKCYEIINQRDGAYFGKKTFFRLLITFCTFFGIILLEIVYGLLKSFGWLEWWHQ